VPKQKKTVQNEEEDFQITVKKKGKTLPAADEECEFEITKKKK
jgi:hypothetical protein